MYWVSGGCGFEVGQMTGVCRLGGTQSLGSVLIFEAVRQVSH